MRVLYVYDGEAHIDGQLVGAYPIRVKSMANNDLPLTIGGLTVEVCGSAQEAIDRAPRFGPDMIVLDVMMPGIDGFATFEALRRIPTLSRTPVVFMTARAQAQDLARYRDLGSLGVVRKPFEPATLADTLRELWEARAE